MANTISFKGLTVEFDVSNFVPAKVITIAGVSIEMSDMDVFATDETIFTSATARLSGGEVVDNSELQLSSISVKMLDTPYVPPEVYVYGVNVIMRGVNDTDTSACIAYGVQALSEDVTQPNLSSVTSYGVNAISADRIGLPDSTITAVGLSSHLIDYIPAPAEPSPGLEIIARKKMIQGGKYTMEAVADHLGATIGCNGYLDGFEIISSTEDSVTVGPGTFLYEGKVAESDSIETYTDEDDLLEPYYLCGRITRPADDYVVSMFVTNDPQDLAIVCINDGGWRPWNTVRLLNMWKGFDDHTPLPTHVSPEEYHGLKDLQTPGSPSYICKLTASEYEIGNAHYVYAVLSSAIEATDSRPPSSLKNVFTDTLYNGTKLIPSGLKGTFANHIHTENYGPLGVYSDSDHLIETGIIATVKNIGDHIIFGAKVVSTNTGADARFGLSTNGSTFEVEPKEPGVFIPKSSFNPTDDGDYKINVNIKLPVLLDQEGVWANVSDLSFPVACANSNFTSGRICVTGGRDGASLASPTMLFEPRNATTSLLGADIDLQNTFSDVDHDRGSVITFNGKSAAGDIDNSIKEISLISATVKNLATSSNSHSASGAVVGASMIHGTGIDGTDSPTREWSKTNIYTGTTTALQSYPYEVEGLISSRSRHLSAETIHLGGWGDNQLRPEVMSYNSETLQFSTVAEVSPAVMSYGNASAISMRNNVSIAGGASHPDGLLYYGEYHDFSHKTQVFTVKTAQSVILGNSGMALASNGSIYNIGGSSPTSLAEPSVRKFTESGVAVSGWGVEWQ